MNDRPRARIDGVVSERVGDDLVIYDETSQSAHSLSAAAASVWSLCDGNHSSSMIAAELNLEPELVGRAVEELSKSGLLDEAPADGSFVSRRDAAKRLAQIGGAAFVAPMIYSVAVGPAMAAASTCTACASSCTAAGSSYTGTTCTKCCSCGCNKVGSTITCTGLTYPSTCTCDGTCTSGNCLSGKCCTTSGATRVTGATCTSNGQCCSGTCNFGGGGHCT